MVLKNADKCEIFRQDNFFHCNLDIYKTLNSKCQLQDTSVYSQEEKKLYNYDCVIILSHGRRKDFISEKVAPIQSTRNVGNYSRQCTGTLKMKNPDINNVNVLIVTGYATLMRT